MSQPNSPNNEVDLLGAGGFGSPSGIGIGIPSGIGLPAGAAGASGIGLPSGIGDPVGGALDPSGVTAGGPAEAAPAGDAAPKEQPYTGPRQKQKLNVYTVMLVVSFLALTTGCVLLYLELQRWGGVQAWKTGAALPTVSAPALG